MVRALQRKSEEQTQSCFKIVKNGIWTSATPMVTQGALWMAKWSPGYQNGGTSPCKWAVLGNCNGGCVTWNGPAAECVALKSNQLINRWLMFHGWCLMPHGQESPDPLLAMRHEKWNINNQLITRAITNSIFNSFIFAWSPPLSFVVAWGGFSLKERYIKKIGRRGPDEHRDSSNKCSLNFHKQFRKTW